MYRSYSHGIFLIVLGIFYSIYRLSFIYTRNYGSDMRPLIFYLLGGLVFLVAAIFFFVFCKKKRINIFDSVDYLFNYPSMVREKRASRENALRVAQPFLKEYSNPFGKLTLINEFCSVRYNSGKSITAYGDDFNSGWKLSIIANEPTNFTIDEIWDFICLNFIVPTNISTIINICKTNNMKVEISYLGKIEEKEENVVLVEQKPLKTVNEPPKKLIDVNTCSEAELQSLPGINIVQAKKIIKNRENNIYFSSVDDFVLKLKIKPHIADKIRKLITTSDISLQNIEPKQTGRIVDI